MSKVISFLRFAEFDENIAYLYQIKGQWAQKKGKHLEDDSDDPDPSHHFQADDIPALSRRNEGRVFEKIKTMCEVALSQYPNTYEEDMEILADDEPPMSKLTFNQRNMVLFRSGEKEILLFLIELSTFVQRLLAMKFKDAKKATQNLPAKMETCRDYLHNSLIPLLVKENI